MFFFQFFGREQDTSKLVCIVYPRTPDCGTMLEGEVRAMTPLSPSGVANLALWRKAARKEEEDHREDTFFFFNSSYWNHTAVGPC